MINKKTTWSFLRILIPLFFAGIAVVYFTYNKPHRDFNKSPSQFTVESKKLISFYKNNLKEANSKYLDKLNQFIGVHAQSEQFLVESSAQFELVFEENIRIISLFDKREL